MTLVTGIVEDGLHHSPVVRVGRIYLRKSGTVKLTLTSTVIHCDNLLLRRIEGYERNPSLPHILQNVTVVVVIDTPVLYPLLVKLPLLHFAPHPPVEHRLRRTPEHLHPNTDRTGIPLLQRPDNPQLNLMMVKIIVCLAYIYDS